MKRPFRWLFLSLGAVVLLRAGVSMFAAPEHEVLYSADPPLRVCTTSGCVFIYRVTIGNTGREPQPNVRLRLQRDIVERAILRPKLRNFGVVDRNVEMHDDGSQRIYELGLLEPSDRVALELTLQYPENEAGPTWEQILTAVEPVHGQARRGDPASISFARVIWSIFGSFL